MATNSNQKGKRGERLGAELLRSLGYEARRSQQFCGNSEESQDLIHNVPNVRLEMKVGYSADDVASSTPREWIEKLKTETPPGYVPVVLWKRDRRPWLAVLEIGGLLCLTADVERALKGRNENV